MAPTPPLSDSVMTGRLAILARSFRHRNYRLFFSGQFISLIGTWMQSVALSWLIYRLTGSSLSLGLMGFVSQFPVFLFSLPSGVLADRLNRHRILVGTQVASLLQASVLAALVMSGLVQIWHLYVLAALLGIINAVDIPARQAFVIEIVGKEDLHNAIALNSSMFNAARVVGPSLAGILVALIGEGWCFTLNAVSFLAVIAGLLLMRLDRRPTPAARASVLAHILEGCRYAWSQPVVRAALLLLGVGSLVGVAYLTLMPVFAGDILRGGPKTLGVLVASAGVGSMLGALALAARRGTAGLERIVLLSTYAFGVFQVAFAFSRDLTLSTVILLPLGFSMIVYMAGVNTLLQTLVPDELRGRIMALFSMMIIGMAPFGSLLAGGLAHLVGAPWTVALCGAASVAVAAVFGRHLLGSRG